MITLTATSRSYGNTGQYIAHITGKDKQYGFAREFTGRKNGSTTTAYIDEPGLYEIGDIDKKGRKNAGCVVVIPRPDSCPPLSADADPDLMSFGVGDEDAAKIVSRMDAGESLADMVEMTPGASGVGYNRRLRDKREAKKASAAVTIDSAIEACWQAMQSLPEREAKIVLAALESRVSPKAVAEPTPAAPAVEVTEIKTAETVAASSEVSE